MGKQAITVTVHKLQIEFEPNIDTRRIKACIA